LHLTARSSQRKSSGGESALSSAEDSIAELASLAVTAGARVVESQIQSRPKVDSATQIGSGKVEELKTLIHLHQADVVIFDPKAEWTFNAKATKSKSKNTPFDGWTMQGKVHYTISEGRVVFKA